MKIELILGILFLVSQVVAGIYAKKKQMERKRRLEEQGWQNGGTVADEDEESDLYDIFEEEPARPQSERPGEPQTPPRTSADRPDATPMPFPDPPARGRQAEREVPPPFVRPERSTHTGPAPLPMPSQRPAQVRAPMPPPPPRQPEPPRPVRKSSVRIERGVSQRDIENAKRAADRAASRKARQQLSLLRGTRGTVAAKTAKSTKAASVALAKDVARRAKLAGVNATSEAHAAALGASTAASVRATLRDPTRMRSAFVTAEVLKPPPSA